MTLGSLKLVYHIDGDGGNLVDSMDLLNWAQGFELAEGGWIQQVPAGDNVTLIETLTFRIRALSQDGLADILQKFDEWITRVNYYRSNAMRTAVWIRAAAAGETNPRQALITAMQYAISDSAFGTHWADSHFIGNLTVVLERSAWWEEVTATTDTLTALNYLSDVLSAVTGGDVPARICSLKFNSLPVSADRQNFAYFGFKNDRYYNPASFYPARCLNGYEAGAGTGTTFSDDSSAVGGRVAVTSFATATLVQRHFLPMAYVATFNGATITITTLTSDYIRGEYLCLMRAKAEASTTVRARIKIGYKTSSTGDKIYPRVTLTSGAIARWHLYEMGVITLPQDRSSSFNTSLDMAIKLDAERISGSGDLRVDCYILIPIDGMVRLYTDDGFIQGSGGLNRLGLFETTPVLESYGYTLLDSPLQIFDVATIRPRNWSVPLSASVPDVLVGAIDAEATESLPTTDWSGIISYIRRWRTLRGNE